LVSNTGTEGAVVWQIRIPRIILGMLAGAGLAAAGCVLQGILRNPLADPYTLGISGGAALGAAVAITLGIGAVGLPLSAFIGAMISVALVYAVASRKLFSTTALVLGGVILSFLFSALVTLVFSIARPEKAQSAMLWLMGDLSGTAPGVLWTAGALIVIGLAAAASFGREIDALTLGEEKASYLGADPDRTLKILFVIVSLVTGACVAVSGIIGFVGLLVPHFMRRFAGTRHTTLIPASALAGAAFLCLADALARTVIYPVELPVGVITGIIGGAVFLYFLARTKEWEIF
jgi:iron complex transport system permease protein